MPTPHLTCHDIDWFRCPPSRRCTSPAVRDNRFLGWADIGLTENGEVEARKAAHTLAEFGINVDEMFCSYLKRSIKSAWLLADEMDQVCWPLSQAGTTAPLVM